MIEEINSTELHTCLLEITLLPLAHYWHFWYGPLDAAIYGSFILGQTTHGDGGGKKRKNEKTALICKKIGAVFCIG